MKSRNIATWAALTSSTSSNDGASTEIDMSKPSLSYSANGWPIGWNGCSTRGSPRAAKRRGEERCRNVWANVHSPPTDTSTVPGGIAATRSSVVAHMLRARPRLPADRLGRSPGEVRDPGTADRARPRRAGPRRPHSRVVRSTSGRACRCRRPQAQRRASHRARQVGPDEPPPAGPRRRTPPAPGLSFARLLLLLAAPNLNPIPDRIVRYAWRRTFPAEPFGTAYTLPRMHIVSALFVENFEMRQAPGPSTRIDLTGAMFSMAAPSPVPVTVTPHLVG